MAKIIAKVETRRVLSKICPFCKSTAVARQLSFVGTVECTGDKLKEGQRCGVMINRASVGDAVESWERRA